MERWYAPSAPLTALGSSRKAPQEGTGCGNRPPPAATGVVRVHSAWDLAGAGHVPDLADSMRVPRPGFYPAPTRE